MERFLYKFRLLPMMMIVASLAFIIRVGDFVHGVNHMGSASAQEEVTATPPPLGGSMTRSVAPSTNRMLAEENLPAEIEGRLDLDSAGSSVELRPEFQPQGVQGTASGNVMAGANTESLNWRDSSDTDIDSSTVRSGLYEDLAKRRDLLDKKEKEIAVREALLSAAERELNQKLREMTTLRAEIEASMKQRTEEEEAKIASLVKIYEGMKPKDAASIMNTLDLDVLLVIMTKMSERRSSPIMAEMNTERARTLTLMMAEQSRTPLIPELH